ncbi:MAG: L-threonylcarbamoyladenylate synthase [Acidimicrobiaceae bacterium]|jgi:L-threonylcarbamoyladenylate synthase|nr:L-threonylcarbamoyladenylate synthase [Acidimicrobiaceae bacterium]
MAIIDARGDPPPRAAIAAAAAILRAGGIAGVPTDTVYGLAADPFRAGATDRLFKLKRRPRTFELPVLVADAEQALTLATTVPAAAARLMDRFWPGALTLVLPRRQDLNADLGSDDATIGLRCPDHPVPRALCREVGPIATTSANRHGDPSAETAAAVAALGPVVDVILDAGTCSAEASTVVDCTGEEPRLLRQGSVSWDEILAVGRASGS